MKRDLIEYMYRDDFIAFVELAFQIVHPRKTLKSSWHHDVIAEHLEFCRIGQLPRLIINAPPRSLKSFIASVAFPAFALGQNPMMQIMSIVANQELAGELLDRLERLMSAARYRSLFPHIHIKRTRNSLGTGHGGSFKSTPLYTSPIGRGADLIILDDPMSSTDARNERATKAALDWLTSEVFSRLNDKASAPIILVMQRLSHHDLTARCSDWHRLKITAIARKPEVHRLPDRTQPWI